MPSKIPIVVPPMRGEPAYNRYLDRLEDEAKRRGFTVQNRTDTVELALNLLGLQWGIRAPRRAQPIGTNRFGRPQKKFQKTPE